MKKRIISLTIIIIILMCAIIAFIKINSNFEKDKELKESGIKSLINGYWISCNKKDCLELFYDKKVNYFCIGELQSDAQYCGEISSESKLNDNRYDLMIYHSKIDCDIKDPDCKMMCDEINCEESSRTYSVDISEVSNNKIYIKLYGYEGFLDKYTSFDNRGDYTYDSDLKNIFKNNRIIMEENS